MANQPNQGGGGLATPPDQIAPAVASVEDVTDTRASRRTRCALSHADEYMSLVRVALVAELDRITADKTEPSGGQQQPAVYGKTPRCRPPRAR